MMKKIMAFSAVVLSAHIANAEIADYFTSTYLEDQYGNQFSRMTDSVLKDFTYDVDVNNDASFNTKASSINFNNEDEAQNAKTQKQHAGKFEEHLAKTRVFIKKAVETVCEFISHVWSYF